MKDTTNKEIIEAEIKLRKISGIIKQNGRKILKNYPITSTQFVALQWMTESDELTIGELSGKIGLAFSTTTDLIDRMENNELVERVRDSVDRRVVRVRVLNEGKEIIAEVIEKRRDYLEEVFEGFSNEQAIKLNNALDLLLKQLIQVDIKMKEVKR